MLIVNLVTEFRVSIFEQFLETRPSADLAEAVVGLVFKEKAFCLFSLLFGVGLAIQFERFSAAGRPLYWLARRLAVLLAIGLIHLLFIWNGDILTEYAVAGFLVLPLLRLQQRGLLIAGCVLLVLYAVGPALYSIPWPGDDELAAHVAAANQVYGAGTLREIWQFSLQELPLVGALHAFVLLRTLALFVFGVYLWRVGVVRSPQRFSDETGLVAVAGIVVGGALTVAGATGAQVVLAFGYAAALWSLARLPAGRRALYLFAPIGRMAFTNYLLQSIVLGLVFFGYGFGWFGRMSAAAGFALGVALYIAQLLFSRGWLRRYRFGPIEWLWRTLTYGATQPWRR